MGYPQRGFLHDAPLRVVVLPRQYPTRSGDELGSWLSKAIRATKINIAHAPAVVKPLVDYAIPIVGGFLAPFTGGASLLVSAAAAVKKAAPLVSTGVKLVNASQTVKSTAPTSKMLAPQTVYTAPVETPGVDDMSSGTQPSVVGSEASSLLNNPAVLIGGGVLAFLVVTNLSGKRQ